MTDPSTTTDTDTEARDAPLPAAADPTPEAPAAELEPEPEPPAVSETPSVPRGAPPAEDAAIDQDAPIEETTDDGGICPHPKPIVVGRTRGGRHRGTLLVSWCSACGAIRTGNGEWRSPDADAEDVEAVSADGQEGWTTGGGG